MTQRYKSKVWICAASIASTLALSGGVNLVARAEPAGVGGTLPGDTVLGRFELFSPAFSGIGSNSLADVARRFPGGIFGAHNPKVIHAANPEAKAYRYQLGPFIQIRYVPRHLVPPSHPFYAEAGTASPLLPESALVKQGPGERTSQHWQSQPFSGFCLFDSWVA